MDKAKFQEKLNVKKILIWLAIIWGIIVLGIVIFYLCTLGKIRVDVEYAPFAAKVTLNDTVIMNHHANYISPGDYHIKVEFENFETYEADVAVDSETQYLFGSLSPANEEGEKYVQDHISEFNVIEGIAGKVANIEGEKQRQTYPIMDSLPIKDPYYTIGYTISDDGALSVTVESSISYRSQAVTRVLELLDEEDFEKYDIKFYNLENPYAENFQPNSATDPNEYIRTGFSSLSGDVANFEIGGGEREGDYYYAYLRYFYKKYIGVVYRVVLKADGDSWQLVADPYPLLTTTNTPGVPRDIIIKANNL